MPIVEVVGRTDAENGRALIEELAALAHEQWIEWSMNIAYKEILSQKRIRRWKTLTEAYKESDRKQARKVLEVINRNDKN